MSSKLEDRIDTYIGHFNDRVARLKGYEFHEKDRLFKKNLLVSVLDAVSRTTSNVNDGNRDRLVGIIENFGDWPERSRISTPHVAYLLQHLRSPAFQGARQFVTEWMQRNSNGALIALSADPEFEEFTKVWPVQASQKLMGQLGLSSLTHVSLFYQYRNSLVHELREPGYGMEFEQQTDEPYYHGMTAVDAVGATTSTLELVYPLAFYFRLVDSVLPNVRTYLLQNEIDPYRSYRFGSSWIGELNS